MPWVRAVTALVQQLARHCLEQRELLVVSGGQYTRIDSQVLHACGWSALVSIVTPSGNQVEIWAERIPRCPEVPMRGLAMAIAMGKASGVQQVVTLVVER